MTSEKLKDTIQRDVNLKRNRAKTLEILGVIYIIIAVAILFLGNFYAPKRNILIIELISTIFFVLAIISFVAALKIRKDYEYGLGGGMKRLIWWIAIIILILNLLGGIAMTIINLIAFKIIDIGFLIWSIISIILIYYLFTNTKVKDYFGIK